MRITKKALAAGAAIAAVTAIPVAVSASGDTDSPITGTDLERASDAALAHVGQGQVTGSEVGDEESYYEIEVRLDDARQVDVQLDEAFAVVGSEEDGTGPDDGDEG